MSSKGLIVQFEQIKNPDHLSTIGVFKENIYIVMRASR
jgi:hypothetical protein